MEYERIPAEKFRFVQENEVLHDKELQTKSRSFFADAMIRFGKNKSSVVAAWILGFLILYAVIAPLISPYNIRNLDTIYINYPPFLRSVADMGIGILDGATTLNSQNDNSLLALKAIGIETGMEPVIRVLGTHETEVKKKGQLTTQVTYDIEVN